MVDAAFITEAYARDGYVFPLDVLDADEVTAVRAEVERAEQNPPAHVPVNRFSASYLRADVHLVLPALHDLVQHPTILDAAEAVLGPDLMVWGCSLFIKESNTADHVSWHQDLHYWGLDGVDEATAWLALTPVTKANGAMRFVAGSHLLGDVGHTDTSDDANLLSRGQELAVDVDEKDAVVVALKPGQMSLHHGRMFHASGPNQSRSRRIGLAIRYVTPAMKQTVADRDYALLVRGEDRHGNWHPVARPVAPFDAAALALHDEIARTRDPAFYQGVDRAS